MSTPQWVVDLIKKVFPSRFILAKMTHLPVVGRAIDYALFDGDDIVYLPRNETLLVGEDVSMATELVLPSQLVEHFINQANYHWIMDFCICRQSSECQDYPQELGCLFMGQAVLGINPHFGRLVSKDEALAHVARCRDAGLVHMVGRNKLDAMWLNVRPGEKLLTVCNCCPCCCLWKILPQLTPLIGRKINRMPGVQVEVTEDCLGCGTCTEGICFVDAIKLVGDRAFVSNECRGCGRCVEVCPNQSIQLTVEDATYIQTTIERLGPLVDLS
jgi:ferredoxin